MVFAIIIGLIVIAYIALLVYEIKNAEEVDPTKPFLYGDYDPLKDPTLKR